MNKSLSIKYKYFFQLLIAGTVFVFAWFGLSHKSESAGSAGVTKYNPFDNPHFNEDPHAPASDTVAGQYGAAASGERLKYDPLNDRYTYEEAGASPRYNPHSRQYEMAEPQEVLKYNPFNHRYSYEDPGAIPRYNTFNRRYEMATPDKKLKYDPHNNRYSFEDPSAVPRYNPMTKDYEMVRPDTIFNDSAPDWAFEKNKTALRK